MFPKEEIVNGSNWAKRTDNPERSLNRNEENQDESSSPTTPELQD
jgi:hypothetical protein